MHMHNYVNFQCSHVAEYFNGISNWYKLYIPVSEVQVSAQYFNMHCKLFLSNYEIKCFALFVVDDEETSDCFHRAAKEVGSLADRRK